MDSMKDVHSGMPFSGHLLGRKHVGSLVEKVPLYASGSVIDLTRTLWLMAELSCMIHIHIAEFIAFTCQSGSCRRPRIFCQAKISS